MPPRTLLSSEQRTRLFAIPNDSVEMVRHYVLGAEDLALIRTKRRSINRLGFAVQLITDNTEARACARSIAGWKPLPPQLRPVTRLRPRKDA